MNHLKNASIIDVRTPQEYAQGHYQNAVNIPLDQIMQHVDEIKEMKKPIVTYCRSGNRSGMAARLLKQYGIQEVYNGGSLDDLIKQTN